MSQGSVTADAAVRSVLLEDFAARLPVFRALRFAVFVWCKCLSSECFIPPLITCFHCETPAHPLLPKFQSLVLIAPISTSRIVLVFLRFLGTVIARSQKSVL